MPENLKLKNTIKVFRAKHDMSQQDLALKVGVRRETIGSLEKGKYNPSLLLVVEIANVFQVTVEELFPDAYALAAPKKEEH
jgi:putative transcriptional regulator